MSADLLRRAAKVLREHAEAASPWPWISATHTGRKDGVSLIGSAADRGTGKAIAVLAGADVHQRAADARFVELMHPPVVLALAGLLIEVADHIDASAPLAETLGLEPHEVLNMSGPAIAVARAILREES